MITRQAIKCNPHFPVYGLQKSGGVFGERLFGDLGKVILINITYKILLQHYNNQQHC